MPWPLNTYHHHRGFVNLNLPDNNSPPYMRFVLPMLILPGNSIQPYMIQNMPQMLILWLNHIYLRDMLYMPMRHRLNRYLWHTMQDMMTLHQQNHNIPH